LNALRIEGIDDCEFVKDTFGQTHAHNVGDDNATFKLIWDYACFTERVSELGDHNIPANETMAGQISSFLLGNVSNVLQHKHVPVDVLEPNDWDPAFDVLSGL